MAGVKCIQAPRPRASCGEGDLNAFHLSPIGSSLPTPASSPSVAPGPIASPGPLHLNKPMVGIADG
jgi:hypothetical protein